MSRSMNFLLLDNDINSTELFAKMHNIKDNDYNVIGRALDLSGALSYFTNGSVDVVFCADRPGFEASEFVRQLTRIKKVTCIVVGYVKEAEKVRDCFMAGAVDYIFAPVTDEKLNAAISGVTEKVESGTLEKYYGRAVDEFFDEHFSDKEDKRFARRLKTFILESFGVTVTTENAADYFNFNKDYFGRIFKSEFNMTFGDFYRLFRMDYAESLLLSGRYKVYEVSSILGFSSVDYFSSVFKKIKGTSPSVTKKL